MHELSIVMSIIQIAEKESAKNNAAGVDEIELEIGALSGIEMTAFDFAWQQAIHSTLLEKATRTINFIPGEGKCMDCHALFPMQQLYEPCPVCGDHFVSVLKGKELRVKSLVIN